VQLLDSRRPQPAPHRLMFLEHISYVDSSSLIFEVLDRICFHLFKQSAVGTIYMEKNGTIRNQHHHLNESATMHMCIYGIKTCNLNIYDEEILYYKIFIYKVV
jgi:hypothetical protein